MRTNVMEIVIISQNILCQEDAFRHVYMEIAFR